MKVFLLILGILTAGSGAWFVTAGRSDSPAATRNTSARLVVVTRRDIGATVLATGVVRPQVGAEVRVGSRVSGVLERLYVTDGDQVHRGQLLARLDSAEYAARYAQALANLENARAESTYAAGEYGRAQDLRNTTTRSNPLRPCHSAIISEIIFEAA